MEKKSQYFMNSARLPIFFLLYSCVLIIVGVHLGSILPVVVTTP